MDFLGAALDISTCITTLMLRIFCNTQWNGLLQLQDNGGEAHVTSFGLMLVSLMMYAAATRRR